MTALAMLAESLLFQMDELLTTDDVQGGSIGGSMLSAGAMCIAFAVEFRRFFFKNIYLYSIHNIASLGEPR